MASSDSKAPPFEKFEVRADALDGAYTVLFSPSPWKDARMQNWDYDRWQQHKLDQLHFIEAAIREKLEREHGA